MLDYIIENIRKIFDFFKRTFGIDPVTIIMSTITFFLGNLKSRSQDIKNKKVDQFDKVFKPLSIKFKKIDLNNFTEDKILLDNAKNFINDIEEIIYDPNNYNYINDKLEYMIDEIKKNIEEENIENIQKDYNELKEYIKEQYDYYKKKFNYPNRKFKKQEDLNTTLIVNKFKKDAINYLIALLFTCIIIVPVILFIYYFIQYNKNLNIATISTDTPYLENIFNNYFDSIPMFVIIYILILLVSILSSVGVYIKEIMEKINNRLKNTTFINKLKNNSFVKKIIRIFSYLNGSDIEINKTAYFILFISIITIIIASNGLKAIRESYILLIIFLIALMLFSHIISVLLLRLFYFIKNKMFKFLTYINNRNKASKKEKNKDKGLKK